MKRSEREQPARVDLTSRIRELVHHEASPVHSENLGHTPRSDLGEPPSGGRFGSERGRRLLHDHRATVSGDADDAREPPVLELHELSRSAASTVLQRRVHPPHQLALPARPMPGRTRAGEVATFLGDPVSDHLSVVTAYRLVEADPRAWASRDRSGICRDHSVITAACLCADDEHIEPKGSCTSGDAAGVHDG